MVNKPMLHVTGSDSHRREDAASRTSGALTHANVQAEPSVQTGKFGALIYQFRTARRLSQSQAAAHAGLSASYWSELENSRRRPPPPTTIARMADGLGVTVRQREELMAVGAAEAEQLDLHGVSQPVRDLLCRIHLAAPNMSDDFARAITSVVREAYS